MNLNILSLIVLMMSPFSYDFGKEASTSDWFALNDNVMGGISKGTLEYKDDHLVFRGQLSLENNGGFASIRSPYTDLDLSDNKKVEIRCKGYGGTFEITMARHREWYLPNYKAAFTPTEEWKVFSFPIRDFKEYRIGEATGGKLNKELSEDIIRLGIIKGDKNTSKFELEVDYIRIE